MKTTELDDIAGRLELMTSDSAPIETRGIENPNQAVTPSQLDAIWGYGPTRSGVQINENTAITFTAVFAAVRILSESIGMLPLGIFQGDDDEEVKVRAKDHPAYPLVRWQPNPEMSATSFKEAVQANLTLWGNGYARIQVDGAGRPKRLLPLASDRTHPERVGGQLRYVVEGGGGRFAPEEILHIPGLSLNGLTGLSPVAYNREAIAMGKAAEIFGATFYGNGAQVGGVLEFPAVLTPVQMATVRESWAAMHAGVGNAHKTGIVPMGGKYNKIGIPPDEAQFLETRKFQVTEIARIYRIPPHMLGDLERATNANIEQQALEFLVNTLTPWLEKWEQELTRKLCGVDGEFHVKFDVRRLLRTDMAARQKFYESGRQWGYLNADQIAAMEGMEPLPNGQGQTYYAPVNMVPLDKFRDMPRPAAPPAPVPSPQPTPKPEARDAAIAMRDVFADAIGRMLRKEANAIGRGKADDDFYTQHRLHVREALAPAARSLLMLAGESTVTDAVLSVIDDFASERHDHLNGNAEAMAKSKATEIPQRILERIGTP